MIFYIYIIVYSMVIYCNLPEPGCVQTSFGFFDKAVAAGIVELIFEIPFMVRIYLKKNDTPS